MPCPTINRKGSFCSRWDQNKRPAGRKYAE